MKRLHTFGFQERARASLLKELLENEGIECLLKNDQLGSALGEIPFTECFPELWLVDEEYYPKANNILNNWLKEPPSNNRWRCTNCGEELEGQFDSCWSCGTERD